METIDKGKLIKAKHKKTKIIFQYLEILNKSYDSILDVPEDNETLIKLRALLSPRKDLRTYYDSIFTKPQKWGVLMYHIHTLEEQYDSLKDVPELNEDLLYLRLVLGKPFNKPPKVHHNYQSRHKPMPRHRVGKKFVDTDKLIHAPYYVYQVEDIKHRTFLYFNNIPEMENRVPRYRDLLNSMKQNRSQSHGDYILRKGRFFKDNIKNSLWKPEDCTHFVYIEKEKLTGKKF